MWNRGFISPWKINFIVMSLEKVELKYAQKNNAVKESLELKQKTFGRVQTQPVVHNLKNGLRVTTNFIFIL